MRRTVLLTLVLASCAPPLDPAPDGGDVCWEPSPQSVFVAGLTSPTPGCALVGQPVGVLDLKTVGFAPAGGVLVVPPTDAGTALPLVLVFHGAGGTGAGIRDGLALEPAADGGAIFVYPNARRGTWDIGGRTPDGPMVSTLISGIASQYCVDPARIYAAGFSAGAVFTLFLGCNVPETFRAVGAVAGTEDRFPASCCHGHVSAIIIHGTADTTIPFGQAQDSIFRLRGRDQCGEATTPDGSHCEAYACATGEALDFCTWDGDHDVPQWGGSEVWRFFSSAP